MPSVADDTVACVPMGDTRNRIEAGRHQERILALARTHGLTSCDASYVIAAE